MAKKNKLVISIDFRETRVALIEDGIIAELHLERTGSRAGHTGTVGNVYLGKVTRVLPGLQAAFIDIGQERAAFLHVEDLIRPDDFEAYLAGSRKGSALTEDAAGAPTSESEAPAAEAAPQEAAKVAGRRRSRRPARLAAAPEAEVVEAEVELEPAIPVDHSEAVLAAAASEPTLTDSGWSEPELPSSEDSSGALPDSSDSSGDVSAPDSSSGDVSAPDSSGDVAAEDEDDEDDDEADDEAAPAQLSLEDTVALSAADLSEMTLAALTGSRRAAQAASTNANESSESAETEADAKRAPQLDLADMPGFTISDPGDPVPPAPREDERRGGGGRRGRGRKGRGQNAPRERGNGNRGARRQNDGDNLHSPLRISKSTPIREVVKEGQEILVQVSKDPIGTKGARCTSHVSLPGRYVVYLPTVDHVGVSKRIGSDQERARLREAINGIKPPSGGFIVRTVAEGLTKKALKQDVGYLVHQWNDVTKKRESAKAPALLSSELDLVLKTARDLFTDEVSHIVIDDKAQYERLVRFLEMFAPERAKDVQLYTGSEPIFDAYGIEDEIQRALARKVPLPSGGYLIIDQAEALTAIDVNTGQFVGKGSKDMEETILQTNLEAVHEIAYQLRFRNIGGLIILDLIDMERAASREKVRRTLEDLLQKDKAKTTLNRISDLGLIEMTRKRTRESLGRLLHEPCFYCDGLGQLKSKETIAHEILRDIRRKVADMPGYTIAVSAHPAVCDLLSGAVRPALTDAENRYMRKISVTPRKDYHLEQFDIQGR